MKARSVSIRWALLCALCLSAPSLAAQQHETSIARKDVPAPVLAAFAKAYPNAVIKGYSREVENGKTFYEVESTVGKTHLDVLYDPDGKLIVVEESIAFSQLPAAVQQAVNTRFPNAMIKLVEKLTRQSGLTYELHLQHNQKEIEVSLDPSGKVLESKPAGKD